MPPARTSTLTAGLGPAMVRLRALLVDLPRHALLAIAPVQLRGREKHAGAGIPTLEERRHGRDVGSAVPDELLAPERQVSIPHDLHAEANPVHGRMVVDSEVIVGADAVGDDDAVAISFLKDRDAPRIVREQEDAP